MTASSQEQSLVRLGRWLQESGYRFTTPTPATHARVNARAGAQQARNLRDVFGWSRPFDAGLLPAEALGWLRAGELLAREGELWRSRVRFSSLGGQLYAHSAYPTSEPDAVFFGPDTYRFAALIELELQHQALRPGARILDVGCGAGPGGMAAALAAAAANPHLALADINPQALLHARANAALAGLGDASFVQSDLYAQVQGQFDLVVANPPYLVDATARTYRHGGGPLGGGLSERIVAEGLPRLAPGGRLVLYTGAAIVEGRDPLAEALQPLVEQGGCSWLYWELDPDVFGEELEAPAYREAERIAAVAMVAQRRPG
jgi:methylase of polypeptide subunit release factors